MKPRLLMTGANGFLGSRIRTRLHMFFDLQMMGRQELDVTDKNNVSDVISSLKPDYILHGAAVTSTDFCNTHPNIAHNINVKGAINVGYAAKKQGAKFLFLSTEQIFNGNEEAGPYDENTRPQPNTVYGENKQEAEQKLQDIFHNEILIFRLTWLFGLPEYKSSTPSNIVKNTIDTLIRNEKCIESDCEFRGMTYVHELIDSFIDLIHLPNGIYHVGSENNLSRYAITAFILEHLGRSVPQYLEKKQYQKNRDIRLSTEKAKTYNIAFSSTKEAIMQCLTDFELIRHN